MAKQLSLPGTRTFQPPRLRSDEALRQWMRCIRKEKEAKRKAEEERKMDIRKRLKELEEEHARGIAMM